MCMIQVIQIENGLHARDSLVRVRLPDFERTFLVNQLSTYVAAARAPGDAKNFHPGIVHRTAGMVRDMMFQSAALKY